MDKTKFDYVLNLNDPNFASKLKEAIGVKDGDTVRFMTPQFKRTDGLLVPIPVVDFANIAQLPESTLKAIGCQKWDDPDKNGYVTWLFPYEWYPHLPDGLPIVDIFGEEGVFKKGETDDDMRCGALSFGFKRKHDAIAHTHTPSSEV